MARRFKLRWVASKKKPEGYWQLSRNLRSNFWSLSLDDPEAWVSGFDTLGVKLPDSDWKRRANTSSYKHGCARLADVLSNLKEAGIPEGDILVAGSIPPELGPIFDGVFAGKDLGKKSDS